MATLSSMLGGSSGGIKSVQRGTFQIPMYNTVGNITISSVNLSKSFLVIDMVTYNNNGDGTVHGTGYLSSSTNISWNTIWPHHYSPGDTLGVWQVIEYN